MSIQLQIEEMPDYLKAKFTGAGTPEEVWRQFDLIAEHCKRANKNKLLLDFREARGKVSLTDRYLAGKNAQVFAHYKIIKVAGVDRLEQLDPNRFGETVVRNRGVNARAFSNIEDAELWLLE